MKRSKRSKSTKPRPAPSRGASAPTAKPVRAIVPALALIALAAVAVYSSSFAGVLVFDDDPWILHNSSIRSLWRIWQVLFPPDAKLVGGRPVVSLTLAANYALGGLNVWGYHAVNLAIHIMAAWTLFGITRRTLVLPHFKERFVLAATPLALAVALLWTVHPLQTESVTYVIQRTESLVGLFYLLTLYCVIRGATAADSVPWYAAATAACLLGMATKEVMATAPLLVLLYDRTFLAGSFREALRRRWMLYLALAATWSVALALLIATDFHGSTTGFAVQKVTWWSYLLTQPGVIVHYVRLAFWPAGLCLDYGWPAATRIDEILVPGILVVGLLGLTVWALVKRPAWGFLGASFFVILAPSSSFIPIQDMAFEHRMYLALAAVVAGVVLGGFVAGQWLVRSGKITRPTVQFVGRAAVLSAGVALGIVTFQRNLAYQSDLSIWMDTVAKAPANERAYLNLGNALANCGRSDEAIARYQKALAINPNYHERAYLNLGNVLAERQQSDEAIANYQKALVLNPNYAEAHYNLGRALAGRRRMDEAVAEYGKALALKPDYADAHINLGAALAGQGRMGEALAHCQKAVEINPNSAEAHNNLGNALAMSGKVDQALPHFQKAVEIDPDGAEAHNNLGNALGQSGHVDEAMTQFDMALKIKPNYAEAHHGLGLALAQHGRLDEAIAHFRKALEINPDFADAQKDLNYALSLKRRAN